jgi:hypothetical protein
MGATGKTIEEAVFWFTSLDKCCHVQLMADAAAGGRGHETVKITDEDAAFTYKTVGRGLSFRLRLTAGAGRISGRWVVLRQAGVRQHDSFGRRLVPRLMWRTRSSPGSATSACTKDWEASIHAEKLERAGISWPVRGDFHLSM